MLARLPFAITEKLDPGAVNDRFKGPSASVFYERFSLLLRNVEVLLL